jgi:16S rRNA (uracil1498-N3)-methyltransferase
MKALWQDQLRVEEKYLLNTSELHHLLNVTRSEVGEELLLLNGQGLKVWTRIDSITKKEVCLTYLNSKHEVRQYRIAAAIGMPKREALELCLKQAVELGLSEIYLVKSAYSQMRHPEPERIHKVLISAVEQSNAAFIPRIINASWEEIPWSSYQLCSYFDSLAAGGSAPLAPVESCLMVIGPEGGLSPAEVDLLNSQANLLSVHLPTPILRTPTALAAAAGYVIGALLDRSKYAKL